MDTDIIRNLSVKATTDGVEAATAAIGKLSDATAQVVTISEKSTASTTSVQGSFDRLVRSLDPAVASQQKYATASATLQRALDQGLVSQDRYNQLVAAAADKYNQTTLSSKAFQAALSGVSGQLIALSAGAGPVGVFLSALGPWGVAAAVGIGAVSSAFSSMAESATKFGQAAIETQKFLLATGLTVDQFSSLKRAASDFGITGDEVTLRVENFTKQLEGLNDATGPLYDLIRKVNPELANQAIAARGTAAEILLVAQAYKQATAAQASQIANQSFGKGGVSLGPLLGSIANQGGLDAMKGAEDDLNKALAEELRQRAAIAAAIQKANDDAEKIYVKLYGDTTQKAQLYLAQKSLEWAEGIKSAAGYALQVVDAFRQASLYASEHSGGVSGGPSMPVPNPPRSFSEGGGAIMPALTPAARNPLSIDVGVTATAAANAFKAYATAMNGALTPAEDLHGKMLDLQKSLEDHVITADDAAHKQQILNSAFNADAISRNTAALGSAATPTEQLADKISQLGQKLNEGKIYLDTYNRSVANLRNEDAVEAINRMVTALGSAATPAELETQRLAQLKLQLDQGKISWDTYGRAAANTSPQLAQLAQDGSNLSKQFDTLGTTSLNNIGNELGDIATGADTLSDGIKKLEQQFVKSLINMVFQMTIAKTAAQGLQSIFSAFLPGVNPSVPGAIGVVGNNGNIPVPTFADGGIVGQVAASRYIHPAYFDDAPRLDTGGTVPGGGLPAIVHDGEMILNKAQQAAVFGGSNGTLTQHVTFNITGATGKEEIVSMIKAGMAKATQQAITVSSANAPGRQASYAKLGT